MLQDLLIGREDLVMADVMNELRLDLGSPDFCLCPSEARARDTASESLVLGYQYLCSTEGVFTKLCQPQ